VFVLFLGFRRLFWCAVVPAFRLCWLLSVTRLVVYYWRSRFGYGVLFYVFGSRLLCGCDLDGYLVLVWFCLWDYFVWGCLL